MKSVTSVINLSVDLPDEAASLEFGAQLSKTARAGDIICLSGDLGAGKTTFSRGFIAQLTGELEVPSPTYTLLQTYCAPDFEIWHFDLYRLKTPSEIWELGVEDAFYEGVSLIEWPQMMGELWPDGTLNVEIKFNGAARTAHITAPAAWADRLKTMGLENA